MTTHSLSVAETQASEKESAQAVSETMSPVSQSLRKSIKPSVDSTQAPEDAVQVPPSTFINPVTRAPFSDPVVLVDGHSYDRSALIKLAESKEIELDENFWSQSPVNRLLVSLQESFDRDDTNTIDKDLLNCPITKLFQSP